MAKKKIMTLEEKLEEAIVKDAPYEVPKNWVWCKLGYISILVTGNTPSKKNSDYYGQDVPFIKPNDLDQGRRLIHSNEMLSNLGAEKARVLPKGATAVCCIGSIGKSAYLEVEGATNQQINSIIPININTLYVYYYVLSEYFQKELKNNSSATTISIINKSKMANLNIPIPSLKEQQRIVDRIESLFEKLDKAKELIEEAGEGFDKRKAAILEKAFRGELTEKWRKNYNISDNKLLDNIINENKKIKKNFNLTDLSEVYGIPTNWTWIKLKDICEKFKYGTSAKSQIEGKVPVLRMGNLQQGKLIWNNLVYTSNEEEINKYDLVEGDLLFNRTNSPELVGKTSIYNGEMDAIFAGYLIRVRVLNGIDSKYINYFMNSVYAKTRCMEVKSDGVSQSNINAEKLGNFDIPLPSSEEQQEIVRILDKLLGEASKIEELTQLEDQIELIKKSILAKAFRGELGTNCEEDESALELLTEILSKQ
ncbi:restriction endonuclease subunit S [Anaerophilus nitritogenes]|uniref:restriction endonuclease subunit S n=1 Tax=Anaerophilus nitritogenes TaxID=2498136 RepID=UPI00101D50C7|nr:restriction endonuclease subunit S [Anaerophilus nitritogenes]